MKIKYCTDAFLEEFKANFDLYLPMYKNLDIEEINKVFLNPNNVKEGYLEFDYIPLKTSKNSENPEQENVKIVYESLKNLTPAEAIQEKLWVAMYNTYYQESLIDYISTNINSSKIDNKIKSSVIYTWGINRSKIVQNIARLWWLGYYLYDSDNKKNPYHLMEFYIDSSDIIGKSTVFFSSNLTNNKNLRLGIIEGIKELVESGLIENKRKYYVEINKYFNLIGGVRILDYMSRDEIKKETMEYIFTIID